MEQNHLCAIGGFEPKMKFSPRLVESPPPKPPRRRYSEQHSPSYLGNHPPKKCYEETQKDDSKSKRNIGKQAYLSLPASLTASLSNEYDDPYNTQSHASDPSDHNKISKEKESYRKYFLDTFKRKTCHCNKFCDKEKLLSVSQDIDSIKFLKHQSDSSVPSVLDNLLKNSCKDEPLMTSSNLNHCQKSAHKISQRRHSDPVVYHHAQYTNPALSYFNFMKEGALKSNGEHCCDPTSHSAKKSNKVHESASNCSCCKKTFHIVQEIKNLKEMNEKLWQHICSLQNSLENKRKKTHDECVDVSVSDLLSSIYYAQKAKDSAVEERLRIALEERDAALQEMDDLIHTLTRNCDYSDNEKDLNEDKNILSEEGSMGDLPRLLKYQRMLLARLNNVKGVKQDTPSCQLRQVTSERNSALEKVRQLEEDIKNMKTCFDLWHSDNKHWEVTMLDVLNQIMRQRDSALSKVDSAFDIGNIKYRLDSFQQNLLPFEPRSKTVESFKIHHSLSDYKQQNSLKTTDEVRKLKEEILFLNKALESEKKRREQSEKKCLRLERLIHILRKKLNGQDVGVHV